MLNAAMKPINNLALWKDDGIFCLYDPRPLYGLTAEAIGSRLEDYIKAGIALESHGDYYIVKMSGAIHGYGPAIYMIAMQELGAIAPDFNITDSAWNIWYEFLKRSPGNGVVAIPRDINPEWDEAMTISQIDKESPTEFYYKNTRRLIDTYEAEIAHKRIHDIMIIKSARYEQHIFSDTTIDCCQAMYNA